MTFSIWTTRSVESSQQRGIHFETELGYEIAQRYPVDRWYRQGSFHRNIAEKLHNNGLSYVANIETVVRAVRYSLIGNNNPRDGRVFEGKMPTEEYDQIAKNNQMRGRKKAAKTRKENQTGAHDPLNRKKMHEARGVTSWDLGEEWFLIYLSRDNNYRKSTGIDATKISEILNEYWHHGEQSRNNDTVSQKYRKLRKKYGL